MDNCQRLQRDTKISKWAMCPFFKAAYNYNNGRVMIVCEEACEGAKNSMQEFRNKKGMEKYAERFCCQNWKTCPVAKMLNAKYE